MVLGWLQLLSPGYATGHHWYGWHLATLGRYGEAIAELEKAASLGPLSLIIGADLAENYSSGIVMTKR
jgi:hypothetical protein